MPALLHSMARLPRPIPNPGRRSGASVHGTRGHAAAARPSGQHVSGSQRKLTLKLIFETVLKSSENSNVGSCASGTPQTELWSRASRCTPPRVENVFRTSNFEILQFSNYLK